MQRIKTIKIDQASGKAKELLEVLQKKVGKELNIFGAMANSPALLEGYMNLSGALGGGTLSLPLREAIALTLAGIHGCDYCASAHTAIGQGAGATTEELSLNVQGKSSDPKTQAALHFAAALVQKRGRVSEEDLQNVRGAGYSDEAVLEILGVVALNTLTNYFNDAFHTEIDFPLVKSQSECCDKGACC